MRLRSVDLPAFGRLRDFRADLAPGLNLFHGLNEAGKSTLQQAVCALLYGFYDNDRARPDETERHERFRPWSSDGLFRGSLVYDLDDGRSFEVRRDFATADVPTQLLDLASGADISSEFGRGRHGNIPFARRHLGMSRGVFQSCAFISQGEIVQVTAAASPREIGDAVAALADSARRDVSAAAAVSRLEALVSKIGSDRARTAELPRAREALRHAREELQDLDAVRASLADKAQRLEHAQARLAELSRQTVEADFLLHQARARSLSKRLHELEEAEESLRHAREVQDSHREFAGIPAQLRDEVIALRGQRDQALQALERAQADLTAARESLPEDAAAEYESLRSTVGALTAEQIESFENAAYAASHRNVWQAILAALRALGRFAARLARRLLRRSPPEEPPRQRVPAAEAQAILERYHRYLVLRPAVENLDRLERQAAAQASALESVDAQLLALVRGAGIAGHTGAGEAVEAFLEAWRSRQEYHAAVATADEASRRRGLLLNGSTPDDLSARLADSEGRARSLLDANPDLASANGGLSEQDASQSLAHLQQERHQLELTAGALQEELRLTLAQHRPRAEIEEDIERWNRRVRQLERARKAAQTAREVIEQAMVSVYRDFAPAVNAFLSEGIEQVTDGRYHRAHVDPATLKISLLLPETDQVITNPPVSHGTWALAYVLMRIGLAQHMSSIGEPVPLVLDDPFVDVDSQRLPRMLDFLLTLSDRMQVLLFSKDEDVLRWFEAMAAEPQHRLHRLGAAAFAAHTL